MTDDMPDTLYYIQCPHCETYRYTTEDSRLSNIRYYKGLECPECGQIINIDNADIGKYTKKR